MSDRSRWRRRAGLTGAVVGLVFAGAAAGLAAERYAVGRTRLRPDPRAHEQLGRLTGRHSTVVADDGVALHVEEVGPPDAPLAVVFSHGFALEMASWHYQWRDLAATSAVGDGAWRLVFWDQRGHGRSGPLAPEHSTIDWLGRDLRAVIDHVAPDGPVVLVGHSMGGMTIMALADQCPELFGRRVVGVALLATSSGKVAETLLRIPAFLARPFRAAAPVLATSIGKQAYVVEKGRRAGSDLAFLFTRRLAFGSDVGPALVDFVDRMLAATPMDVIAEFLPTFVYHDKLDALAALDDVETLVIVGDRDQVTPVEHSRDIALRLRHSRLVVVPGTGHMVMLERPSLVNLHLRTLFTHVRDANAALAVR